MNLNIFTVIALVPGLVLAAGTLDSQVTALLKDKDIEAELAGSPKLEALAHQLSAEWRTVANDVTAIKKSNFFTFFPALGKLVAAAQMLEKDVVGIEHDPTIAAELAKCPVLSARITAISVAWRTVEEDLNVIIH